VRDRCVKSHEYVFLLTKNKNYFFDPEPIRNITGSLKRSVWTVKVKPFKGAHFSTFPVELIEPMILAGTSHWGHCPECGKGWKRILEKGEPDETWKKACGADSQGEYLGKATKEYARAKAEDPSAVKARILAGMVIRRTVGWAPTCKCGKEPVPGTILDPFIGSGTTAQVAIAHGRKIVGIEMQRDYRDLIKKRIERGKAQRQRRDDFVFKVKANG
jgi:hypothetical protein